MSGISETSSPAASQTQACRPESARSLRDVTFSALDRQRSDLRKLCDFISEAEPTDSAFYGAARDLARRVQIIIEAEKDAALEAAAAKCAEIAASFSKMAEYDSAIGAQSCMALIRQLKTPPLQVGNPAQVETPDGEVQKE